MKRVLILVWSLCWLAGCAVTQPQITRTRPRLIREPIIGGVFYLFVPYDYDRDRPAPLIISCHGTDPFDVAAHQVGEWKWLAEQHGCILVCPKLISTDGILGAGGIGRLLRDERLILTIIAELQYLYNIDRKNIMITGFSGGGFPVYFVGLRHPDVFSVAVARNCNFNRRAVEGWYAPAALSTPVMVYYGENDPGAIRAQSDNAIKYLRSSGFNVHTALIPGAGHERTPEYAMKFFLENFHGTPPPFQPPPNSRVSPVLSPRSPRDLTGR